MSEEEVGLTSTEREGTISDDEIFELEPKGRNIMVNGVHIFECIGMFGNNKGKKFYQCGGCSFMLPVEPRTTSQTPPVERMATHIQNAHKIGDSSSATHSIPPGQHGRNELKDQVATTTSTCSLNAFSKDGKRAYTLLSTPNMEPDTEAPSPKPSTSTMAHQSSRKRQEQAGSSGAHHLDSKKTKYT
ncbi:hypothetical protein Ocin01_17521 [Orchesella cincta]|uniref:Uncharacterized protein n=1 Tax=Orchesella cincta TaxID=48709 RepID=A0A1D2M8A1_ORCCI|nr:hypothetical protein Ocin01_17521 [Orchesella cincta]